MRPSEAAHVLADVIQEAGLWTTEVQGLTVHSPSGTEAGVTFTARPKRGHKQFADVEVMDSKRPNAVLIYVASSSRTLGNELIRILGVSGCDISTQVSPRRVRGARDVFPVMSFWARW